MKKLFTLCAAVLMGSVMAFAQTDNTFRFVDADGNEVPDGTVLERYERHDSIVHFPPPVGDIDNGTMIPAGLYVENTSSEEVFCAIDYQVTQIDGGVFQICFPTNCVPQTTVTDLISTGTGPIQASSKNDLRTEWIVRIASTETEYHGICKATIRLKTMRQVKTGEVGGYPIYDYELVGYGPKVEIIFYNDGTTEGITAPEKAGQAEVEAYYSLDGCRRDVPQKGLNIVKYSDGTAKKVVIR